MHEINTELAIKYLLEELNLRKESELAEKLQITENALSMLKKRNSLGTLIEKVLINIDPKVSMDRLIYGYSSNCFRAQTLAIKNQKEDELVTILENFINSQTIMIKFKTKIQRIKNLEFLEKLRDLANGNSERMLILFYAILLDLKKNKLLITNDNLSIKFSEIIDRHDFSYFDTLKFGIISTKKDFSNLKNWIEKDTTTSPEYTEGVYYPDTYLIPVVEDTALVAKRLIAKFNENFASYLPQFTAKNIKWARALTLASIVQREASSDSDMPLIAGILWNRLNQDMALGVDATLQYIRGDVGKGWWAPITVAEKQTDSPFNTYKYKGLPPHPISNPGVPAISAVLNPTKTDCLYYLHDKSRVTHCAPTYEEHKLNIQKYLIAQ